MPYAIAYDAATAGFDFAGLVPIVGCALAVAALSAAVLRRRSAGGPIRWVVVGLVATATAIALAGVAIDYRNFRLDVEDLEAGRAPVVEGIIDDHELRRGGEHFEVESVPLYTRTSLGGYGMKKGVVSLEDGARVRIHYSLRAHRRRHPVLRLAMAQPTGG